MKSAKTVLIMAIIILVMPVALGAAGRASFDAFFEKNLPEIASMPAKDLPDFTRGMEEVAKTAAKDITKFTVEKIKAIGKMYDGIAAKYGQDIAKITVKGIRDGVIDPKNADLPEKLAQYAKGLGKDPFDAGEQTLVKILKAPGKQTIIGTERVDGVLVLRKGKMVAKENKELWGADHIRDKHSEKLNKEFEKILDDDDIKNIVEKVMNNAPPPKAVTSTDPGIKEAVEKEIEYNGKKAKVRVAYLVKAEYGAMPGDIATVFIP